MQTSKTIEQIEYICDKCSKRYDKKFINFDMIDDIQMRVLEYKPQSMNKHLTYWRKKLDFCRTECALEYLNESMQTFILEITANRPASL